MRNQVRPLLNMFKFGKNKTFQPSFSRDTVEIHKDVWPAILNSYRGLPNMRYLEIGVSEGCSLIWMLQNIFTHSSSRADVIDNFFDKTQNILRKNLGGFQLRRKVSIYKGESSVVIPKLDRQYDVIYIDGCHCPAHILSDSVMSWAKLKPGGLMIFDDYQLESQHQVHNSPKIAVDAFVDCFRPDLEFLHKNFCVVVKKKESSHRYFSR
jgi:predicted O-methyltransferase YrrM